MKAIDHAPLDLLCDDHCMPSPHPFGRQLVLFGGGFRKLLPIHPALGVPGSVTLGMTSSLLWRDVKVLPLSTNMRAQGEASAHFRNWVLRDGDGLDEQTSQQI